MRLALLLPLLAVVGAAQPTELGKGVNVFSLDTEKAMGQHHAEQFSRDHKELESDVVRRYVERIGQRLAAALPSNPYIYSFKIFLDESAPEGYVEPSTLPGGYVFLPTSLFLSAADESEFAGLLAHAVVHVAARHGTRTATRGLIANLATIPLIFMGTGGQSTLVPLGFRSFQRGFEREADLVAIGLLLRAGFDPEGLARYIARAQIDPTVTANAIVPPKQDRLADIRLATSELPAGAYPSTTEFRIVQQEVRTLPPAPSRPHLDPDAPPRIRRP